MKTILVIEDLKAERNLIAALLTNAGFNVVELNTVESAWEWLEKNPNPSLILLDIVLPGKNGYQFCREIRASEKWKETPILFCSSKSQDFDKMWAMHQGGTGYITKPYPPQQLVDTVLNLAEEQHEQN